MSLVRSICARGAWGLVAVALACGCHPSQEAPRLLLSPTLRPCDPKAPMPSRIRVVTWNMEAARGSSIGAIGQVLAGLQPDVVLLQEVDDGVHRTGGINEAETLADALGLAYGFAESVPWDGGHYGLAMLSRLPFASFDRLSLDAPTASERRIAIDASLCLGPRPYRVIDTHADFVPDAEPVNVRELLAAIAGQIGKGLLLGGDLNATVSDPGPQAIFAAGLADVVAPRDASPTSGPNRIDFVVADAVLAPKVTAAQVVASDASDHRPVAVDLTGPF
jgi:endonuclease/exonuclease/phosphatase family metal-dependent hydrolase